MIAVYLSPVYLLLCLYILLRLLIWLEKCCPYLGKKRIRIPVIGGYVFLIFCILIAFLLKPSVGKRLFMQVSNLWLGVMLYTLMILAITDIIRFILKKTSLPVKERLFTRKAHVIIGAVCIFFISCLSIAGIWNADHIKMTDYKISVEKKAGKLDHLNIILVADLHLGYSIGIRHMEQMVDKINQENADLVLIAGDIFDNEYEALEDPEKLSSILGKMKSRYGVYACYGNHDIEEKILAGFTFSSKKKKESDPRMDIFLEKSGIHLLSDEGILIDDAFYLYGRPDFERPGRGIEIRKTPDQITETMDKTKPILVLDHEPRELDELSDAGVDVDLCGHTHDGQTFPGNLTIHLFWENPCGYLKKGKMHNIVTSGIGVFGPDLRVGTKSEICRIKVEFY